ncbi:MAG TPA: hypothetical protein VHK88_07300, partial [Aquihabitans sp.]|nr:hypothetical protein [Aquihabitans sp.]
MAGDLLGRGRTSHDVGCRLTSWGDIGAHLDGRGLPLVEVVEVVGVVGIRGEPRVGGRGGATLVTGAIALAGPVAHVGTGAGSAAGRVVPAVAPRAERAERAERVDPRAGVPVHGVHPTADPDGSAV